jgi:hypothetical protein
MTPSLEIGNGNWAVKSDSLLGYKTINGKYYPREMSVVRATTGTRVNAEGLVEVVPYNLLTYSEQFDNSDWREEYVTLTPNTTTAPNGTLTADTLTANSGNSYLYQLFSAVANTTYTFSCYVKTSNISTTLDIALVNQSGASGIANVSFTTTNNWTRVSVTGLSLTTQNAWVAFGTGGTFITGQQLYIWGAQLVEGTNALDYLPTTTRLNIARIDYSTGSPALLVEPQRTNLCTYSQDFSNAAWNVNFDSGCSIAITPNYTTASNGLPAARLVASRTNTSTLAVVVNYVPNTGTSATKSIWMKNNNAGNVTIMFADEAVTITDTWERYSITNTYPYSIIGLRYSGVALSCDISITGSQFELGNYSTSYIPTTSASVTRNEDQVLKTGISSLIGQTEGTIYLEADIQKHNQSEFYVAISNGFSLGESIYLFQPSGGILQVLFRTGGVDQSISILNANWNIGYNKIAIAYNSTSGEVFMNGVSQGTVALSALPTCSQLTLGARPDIPGNLVGSGGYKSTAIFKTRLTNTQLAQLTTL